MTHPILGTDQAMKYHKLEIDIHPCVVQDFQSALSSGCDLDLEEFLTPTIVFLAAT